MAVIIRQRTRAWIRLLIFTGCVVLLWPAAPLDAWKNVLFSISPYLAFSRITATASWTPWMIPALVFMVVCFFRRRFFCRYVCPTGYALEQCGRWKRRDARRDARIPVMARPMAWIVIGGMAAGYPFLLWLDPLSLFGGVGGLFGMADRSPAWITAIPFLLLVLFTLLLPRVWCGRVCPLGGLQDVLADARSAVRRMRGEAGEAEPRGRRAFLFLLGGLPVGVAMRCWGGATPVVRPPGAASSDVFNGLCSRCGMCSNVCPQKIIQPDLTATGVAGLLTPVLSFRNGYCDEWCERCTQVCPTGALRPLTLEQKQAESLGLAEIDHPACLAWGERKHCVVCQEFCPYHAIDLIDHAGIPCPVVNAARCRGCGACEKECPVLGTKAIQVKPVLAQS